MAKETRLHIRIDEELKKQIDEKASEQNRTTSNYVINLIKQDLEKEN